MTIHGAVFGVAFTLAAAASATELTPLAPKFGPHHSPAVGTEAGLWMVSKQSEEVIQTSPRRLRDPHVEAYLHEVICRLTPDYCGDIRVYLVRMPYFNASMLPNGVMQVWSGLLLRVENEDQLASVLGHELGHFLRQHSLEQFESVKNKATLITIFTLGLGGAVAAGGISSGVAQSASVSSKIAMIGSVMAYGRGHESEADRFGLQLIAKAGYDPLAAARVWQNILDEDAASGDPKKSRSAFLASHPSPENRIADLRRASAALTTQGEKKAPSVSGRYYAVVARVLPTCFLDEVNLNQPGRSEFLFKRLLAAGFAPGLVNFYLGEIERRRSAGKLSDSARAYYEASVAEHDPPADSYRELGLWHLKAKQWDLARARLQEYLAAAPQANDRKMVDYYLQLVESHP
jgi:beta-barrel assembly-enhancing protease